MTECERTALYLDGELPPGEEAAALSHLAGCAQCQAELGDWVGLQTALSRSRSGRAPALGSGRHERIAAPHARRPGRRRWVGVTAAAVMAFAAAVVLWLARDRAAMRVPMAFALAETRTIEARLTAPAFDRHRHYRVERDGPSRELLPWSVFGELERRGDRAGLAAAHALGGDPARAAAVLDSMPPSAARDSDLAAVELATDPVRALQHADAAIAAAPRLAPAHWNRALALRMLELPLAAAAEFDAVAAYGEPGWAEEARQNAAALRAPVLRRKQELEQYTAAATAMIGGTAGPVDADLARARPWLARRDLFDALALAGSAERARALDPLAKELDRLAGNDRASRTVAAVAARDFAIRRRFADRYRAVLARELDGAQGTALIADLERAGDAVADLLVGALLKLPASEATVARLRRIAPADDAWVRIQLASLESRVKQAAGDLYGAEQTLLATAPICRDPAWRFGCGYIDFNLSDLYAAMRRLDETADRLRTAMTAFAREGRPDFADHALLAVVTLERLRDRDRLAAAHLEEIRLRAPGDCANNRFVDEVTATIAFSAGDVATARKRLPDPARCKESPSPVLQALAVGLARIGTAEDRERAEALIAQGRASGGSSAVAAEIVDGRLRIDGDPVGGAAKIRGGLERVASIAGEPGTAGDLRTWGFSSLISDAGRRAAWAEALALFGEELGRAPPGGCLVAASLDDERAVAVVRGRDGVVRGSYQSDRPIGGLAAHSIVPAELAAALTGCDEVAVIARPPLHGRPELLPAALPWSFLGSSTSGAAAPPIPSKRRVVVTDVRPPAMMKLPPLPPIGDDSATLVSGTSATPDRVAAELRDAGYVEIHAHGIIDASDAAFLALSPEPDGRFTLTAGEVGKLRLAGAPTIVLAACRSAKTARYEMRRWSLPDALLGAGARAVIASFTAIPDDQGATLFAELRARIDRGERPGQAVAALRAERVAAGQAWASGLMVFE
jgi:cellulose synthase operon protein C